jgi:hypothetical protein
MEIDSTKLGLSELMTAVRVPETVQRVNNAENATTGAEGLRKAGAIVAVLDLNSDQLG